MHKVSVLTLFIFVSLESKCGHLLDCRHGSNAVDNQLGDLSTVGAQYWHSDGHLH